MTDEILVPIYDRPNITVRELALLRRQVRELTAEVDGAHCIIAELRDTLIKYPMFSQLTRTINACNEYLTGIDPTSGIYGEKLALKAEVERLKEEFDLFKALVEMDGGESIVDHWEYVKKARAALEPK